MAMQPTRAGRQGRRPSAESTYRLRTYIGTLFAWTCAYARVYRLLMQASIVATQTILLQCIMAIVVHKTFCNIPFDFATDVAIVRRSRFTFKGATLQLQKSIVKIRALTLRNT